MSAVRMTYLLIVPAMVSILVPVLAMFFPEALLSHGALDLALAAAITLIVLYAAGLAWLALRDHRRVFASITKAGR